MSNMGDYKVYALFSDVKSNVKYIGYTSKSIIKRLGQHLENCYKGSSAKNKWLRAIIEEGHSVGILELSSFDNIEEALSHERLLIETYSKTHSLVNSSKGGERGFCKNRKRNILKKRSSIKRIPKENYIEFIDSGRSTLEISEKFSTDGVVGALKVSRFKVKEYWKCKNLSKRDRTVLAVTESIDKLISGGYSKYTISDIAEIAGLSRQTVSSIISTKLELNEG